MRWPWTERRAAPPGETDPETGEPGIDTMSSPDGPRDYTEGLADLIYAEAIGSVPDSAALAALEICAGLWQRAWAAATVTPSTPATAGLTPDVLGIMGRELVRRGAAVFAIEVGRGALMLRPAGSWDISGGPDEAGWMYRVDLFGASSSATRRVSSSAVVHVRYSVDAEAPWLGVPPLRRSRATTALAARVEAILERELDSPVGQVGARGTAAPQAAAVRQAIDSKMRGRRRVTVLVGEQSADRSSGDRVQFDRIGPQPPPVMTAIREGVNETIYAACGVPMALATGSAEGTAAREAWRRFVLGTIAPVALIVEHELRVKLDTPDLSLSFDRLAPGGDVSARARAFAALTKGGMDVDRAAKAAGFDPEPRN